MPDSGGEVLDVNEKGKTFLAFHPQTEVLLWLPVAWIKRLWAMNDQGDIAPAWTTRTPGEDPR